ncbi:MAG: DJ-1/PfpI family protein [Bacteroidota bacterium]
MRHALSQLLLLSLLISCQSEAAVEQSPPLPPLPVPSETWQVGFLIMDGVYNTELTAPMDIFQHTIYHHQPGMEVFTVAEEKRPIRTFEGLVITPDYSFEDDSLPTIDILVVPSAEHHLDTDLENEVMINFVREKGRQARYIMSLCDGAFVLAQAGLLDGYQCTTFPSDIPAFRKKFPQLKVHEEVIFVHHGKAITGAGGARSFEPAMYLSERLYGKKAADGIARGMVIDWDVEAIPKVVVSEE